MKTVGTFEAKTHLSELLDQVERGESITITRHGAAVAMLTPMVAARPRRTHAEIVAGLRQLRSQVKPGGPSVREMIAEGRRF